MTIWRSTFRISQEARNESGRKRQDLGFQPSTEEPDIPCHCRTIADPLYAGSTPGRGLTILRRAHLDVDVRRRSPEKCRIPTTQEGCSVRKPFPLLDHRFFGGQLAPGEYRHGRKPHLRDRVCDREQRHGRECGTEKVRRRSEEEREGGLGLRALRHCAPRWGRCGCARRARAARAAPESATSHIAAAMCSNLGSPGSWS